MVIKPAVISTSSVSRCHATLGYITNRVITSVTCQMRLIHEKCVLCQKYSRYPHKTYTIVFTVLSTIKQAKLHLAGSIFGTDSLFGYVIYSSDDAHSNVCVS